MTLVFATNNRHKLKEAKSLLPDSVRLLSLNDIESIDELPETSGTFEGNARQKARYIYDKFGMDCFADDSGLEVDALNGEPGVYSARYAGSGGDAEENMMKLLKELQGVVNRKSRFRTVIVSIIGDEEKSFEGIIDGSITTEKRGRNGFGYDPVFIPEGFERTFAEMDDKEKNQISHRARALKKFIAHLSMLKIK